MTPPPPDTAAAPQDTDPRAAALRLLRLAPDERAVILAGLRGGQRLGQPAADGDGRVTPRRDRTAPVPASYLQEQLLFLDRIAPGRATYNIPFAFRLRGPLDHAALADTLTELARRHEALRTTVDVRRGQAVQIIAEPADAPLPLVDLSGLGPRAREAELAGLLRREARRAFDISRGDLVRCTLYRLGPTEHVLGWTAHHAVADGQSVAVLAEEISALYAPLRLGQPADLPPAPLQFGDYAVWQREQLAGPRRAELVRYWTRRLAGVPDLALPTRRPRPTVQTFEGGHFAFAVPPELAAAVRAVGREAGATLFTSLMAAFQLVLAEWSGQSDFAVGTSVAGRLGPELGGLVGPCLDVVAVRTDLSGDPTPRQLLARTRDAVLEAVEHQDLPFGVLVGELGGSRDPGRNPVFQVMFELGADALGGRRLRLDHGLEMTAGGVPHGVAPVDLLLAADDRGDALTCRVDYNTDLFDEADAAHVAERFHAALEAFAAAPAAPAAAHRT